MRYGGLPVDFRFDLEESFERALFVSTCASLFLSQRLHRPLTGGQASLHLASLASHKLVNLPQLALSEGTYPCQLSIKDSEKIVLERDRTALRRGCLCFDQILYFIVVEVMSPPLRNRPSRQSSSKFHVTQLA